MNQKFSFRRWRLLVAKHVAENKKRYLISMLAQIALLFMWFVFVMKTDRHDPLAPGLQEITFYFSLFLVGPFYATQFFKDIHSRTKGINYILLPASTLEKLLCGLFFTLVFFLLAFTAVFYIADALAVASANAFHPSYTGALPQNGVNKAEITNVFSMRTSEKNPAFYFILLFTAVQSAALLGSAYFASYSYIRTMIALFVLFLLIFLVESFFLTRLLPHGSINENFTAFRFSTSDNKMMQVNLPLWLGAIVSFLIKYAFQPVYWLATYYRLKEKEV